jgi:Mn2+/Fe2+ NRAMP family transporter
LHRFYAPFLFIAVLLWGHLSTAYMLAGIGEISLRLTGFGTKFLWEIAWVAVAYGLIFRPAYGRAEFLFKILVGLLAVSLVGSALWVGFSPVGVIKGIFAFSLPPQHGPFTAVLVAIGMVGAVGGSLVNLVYPYFIEQKGWKGPAYRRVQNFDFLLAVVVMIVFNLAVWTLGAELVHHTGQTIASVDDLALLLQGVLGSAGRVLFLLGVLAAVFTSVVGAGLGLSCLGAHAWLRWRAGNDQPLKGDYRTHQSYRFIVSWILLSPLVWLGKAEFISLTLIANSFTVILIPALAGGLWWITASEKFIGKEYRNRIWDNLLMGFLFILAFYGAYESIRSILRQLNLL